MSLPPKRPLHIGTMVTLEVEVRLTATKIAEAFCALNDEEQAQFFIDAARIMTAWPTPAARTMQAAAIGRHLRDCERSTYEARALVRDIAEEVGT